ncbi:MAG: rRNA maturation RNase YbeY [Candidatus Syntrophosphaera sp.]|nr:rRNA maturation RNase YbeY [Candidatus Syntrophosphaera sp.]
MSKCQFNLTNQSGIDVDEAPLRLCAETVCAGECPAPACEVDLLLCADPQMREFNRLYRGDDSVTDVLCFSAPDELAGLVNPEAEALPCDIIIDINQLDRQKGPNTLEKELMEVFIHGLLHAFGYDHIRRQDQEIMANKEQYYKQMMEGKQHRG